MTGVHDGDTFYIDTDADGERDDIVRPIGWDAPEMSWGVECYGVIAKRRAQALLLGQRVALERDVRDRDSFDRLLRYTYVLSDTEVIWLGSEMVSGGYARAKRYPPDTRYAVVLEALQDVAQRDSRGGWAACGW